MQGEGTRTSRSVYPQARMGETARAVRDAGFGETTQPCRCQLDLQDPAQYPLTRRFAPRSASLGALQALPAGFVASLNGSSVERAPTAYEMVSQGPHDATATFEIGNPTLRRERARTLEASLRRAEGPLRLDATAYVTRITGFIYRAETGLLCDTDFASCGQGTESPQIVYRQRNATFHGSEVAAQLDAIPVGDGWFGVEGQFDTVRARFDDGTNVPRIPPYRVGGGLFLRAGGWFARVNLLPPSRTPRSRRAKPRRRAGTTCGPRSAPPGRWTPPPTAPARSRWGLKAATS